MCRSVVQALSVAMLLSVSVSGQDAATTPAPSFKELLTQRDAAMAKMQELQGAFQAANADDRIAIQEQFKTTVTDLKDRILKQIEVQLPAQLAANPADADVQDAASMVLQIAFGQNRYADVAAIAAQVLKQDPKNALALNFDGVSKFAEHDFAGATKQFQAAEQAEVLIPELGGRYQEDAANYVELWTKEAALREQSDAQADPAKQLPQVLLKTSKGDVLIELFEDSAPNTVANFVSLVESKYYDGLRFHRVIPGFMAQGGCPNTRDNAVGAPGTGGPGYNIKCETENPGSRMHFAGSLSMAHAGKDTGGSQFFLTHLPTSHLNGVHTVFGRVVQGLDIARSLQMGDSIETATVVRKRDHEYKPETLAE